MFKKILFVATLSFLIFISQAQTGKIVGRMIDAKTGETLPGATVLIEGTVKGASADFDGNYSLNGLQEGKYNLIFSYITYDTKKITGIEVKENDVTNFNISLDQSSSQTLTEVVVQAEMNKENTNTLLVMQKNNASVSDGISSESIKKTPDRSTADVIKRISGATIQDNKFAIIRGMSDRYNAGFINGAPLPSSESDKKAFSFDMFPSNILDNIVILKTGRPDLTGEFGGGVIEINTKNVPEKNTLTVAVGAGDNFQTTFKNFQTSKSGKYDWIGFDDGTRALPKGLANPAFTIDKNQQIEDARKFNYDWGLKNKQALPNFNFQGTLSNVAKIGRNGSFGSVFALNYNSSNSTTFTTRRTFENQGSNVDLNKLTEYNDTAYSNVILASALWNLAYKINSNHQITFKNIYSINTDNKVITRNGEYDVQGGNSYEMTNVRFFTQNNIYSGQLGGDHYFEKPKIKVKWIGGYSNILRDIPNLSRMRRTSISENGPYYATFGAYGTDPTSAGSMLFLNTVEHINSMRADVSRAFNLGKTKHELSLGGSSIFRERNFTSRLFGYNHYTKGNTHYANSNLDYLDDSQIFSQQNIGIVPGTIFHHDGGFLVLESTAPKDSYHAYSFTNAGYIMGDSRFFNSKLRLIYGARAESYRQVLDAVLYGKPQIKDTTVLDILPSANVVYSVTEKINVRVAYFRSVARPEFRELAPFTFPDFTTSFYLAGNPSLVRSKIDNYDLRFEWFPNAGQIVSASGFYKKIDNAIEQVLDIGTIGAGNYGTTFANSKSAHNTGVELEIRFKLNSFSHLLDSIKILKDLSIFANCAYIKSQVDNSNIYGNDKTRPLQGQSPYIVNAGIQYQDKSWGAAISYNYVGRRIIIVGGDAYPNIWENPRHILDLQVSKTFWKNRFEAKINLRDGLARGIKIRNKQIITSQNLIWYQDIDENGKLTKGSVEAGQETSHSHAYDNVFINTKLSPTLSISIAYKIF